MSIDLSLRRPIGRVALLVLGLAAGLLAIRAESGETTTTAHAVLPNPWTTNWDAARTQAKAEGKPLVAMFSAVWCPPCQMMKRETLPQPEVQAALAKYVAVYVDEAQNTELIETQKIEAFPTFVIYTAEGVESQRLRGAQDAGDFIRSLDDAREIITELPKAREAAKAQPESVEAQQRLGDLLTKANDAEGALAAYEAAAKLDPENKSGVHADRALARAMKLAESDLKQGESALEQVTLTWPRHPRAAEALFYRGLIAAQRGDRERADALLAQYLKDYPQGRDAARVTSIREQLANMP